MQIEEGLPQRTLLHFEVAPEIGGDIDLLALTREDSPILPSYSPRVGVTFPNYLLPLLSNESDDASVMEDMEDPDWEVVYCDFACDSNASNSDWKLDEPDVFEEVGSLSDVHVDDFTFETRYGEGQWNSLESTLVGDRKSFFGPPPGPTRRQSGRQVEAHEFFDQFRPETDLARICRETNKYALQKNV